MHSAVRSFSAFMAAAALIAAVPVAFADTYTESFGASYSDVTQTEETTTGILAFNSTLGTLNSITETLTGQVLFTPTAADGSYTFNTENLIRMTFTSSQIFDISASAPDLAGLTGSGYYIEALDLEVTDGSVTSVGPVEDSYTFNYTPASTTPEPSGLILLATGIAAAGTTLRRKRPFRPCD